MHRGVLSRVTLILYGTTNGMKPDVNIHTIRLDSHTRLIHTPFINSCREVFVEVIKSIRERKRESLGGGRKGE